MTVKDALSFAKIHQRHLEEMAFAGWTPLHYGGIDDALRTLAEAIRAGYEYHPPKHDIVEHRTDDE